MIRPGCRWTRLSVRGWIILIFAAWLTLWVCARFWPGWPWWHNYYGYMY